MQCDRPAASVAGMDNVQQKKKRPGRTARESHRIAVTVPREVYEVWQAAADSEARSLSSLVAEWLGELAPQLASIVELRAAYESAEAQRRETLRQALSEAAAVAEGQLRGGWQPVQDAIEGLR